MSKPGSIKYQTAAQFEDAIWAAFHLAQEQAPEDPQLQSIHSKWDDAASAQKAYEEHQTSTALPSDPVLPKNKTHAGLMAMLKQRALQTEQDADTALRKWYSNLWRERQTSRR